MRAISVFNSKTRKKEIFKPITEGKVGMYVCGPTVYGDPHLGHARPAITFDVVFRYLKYLDYKVRYVRNVTDVGHLEDEVAGAGEDKIAKKARLDQVEPMEIVQKYTVSYRDSMRKLNTLPPSIEPTATGHIIEQINLVQRILKSGLAYEVKGSVYFDLKKFSEEGKYGELSGKVLDDLRVNTRATEGQSEKRDPLDFAIWKKASPEHIMRWESPWGEGFPGWHMECTAMSSKYLGVPFDIHGGGMDLQFPHHEAEIAQCHGAYGVDPVNYWMHNNMLTINGQKMAKSLGNFITLEQMFDGSAEVLEQAYSPMTVRFFTLQSHYRSTVDFSNEALQAAEKGYKRIMNGLSLVNEMVYVNGTMDKALDKEINELIESLYTHMSDDFNTAKALASLFELSSKVNAMKNGQLAIGSVSEATFNLLKQEYNGFITEVLGLENEQESSGAGTQVLDGVMDLVIDMRTSARENKDWAMSDKIRDDLATIGIKLKDGKGETGYEVM